MKKVFALFFCTFIFLAACAEQQSDEVFNVDYTDGENRAIDMEGAEFVFGTNWYNYYYENDQQTVSGDKMLERYKAVMDEYNCVYTVVKAADSSSELIQNVAAGLATVDVLDMHATNAYDAYKVGMFYRMEDISTIDSTDVKWGPINFRQYGMFDGYTYGFFPWHWAVVGIPQFEGVLLFNGELIKRAALESPFEIQERGEWTWDNYKKYLEAYAAYTDEQTPMMMYSEPRLAQTVIMSNGLDMLTKTDSGYKFAFNCPEAYEALDYMRSLKDAKLLVAGDLPDLTVDLTCVFLSCESYFGTNNTPGANYAPSHLYDFGMISFPYGPNGNATTVSAYVHTTRRLNWISQYGKNDPEDLGIILDYVFAPLDDMGEAAWQNDLQNYVFTNEESFENFMTMLNGIKYNYSGQLQKSFSTYESALTNALRQASTSLDSVAEIINNDIAENVVWIYGE